MRERASARTRQGIGMREEEQVERADRERDRKRVDIKIERKGEIH